MDVNSEENSLKIIPLIDIVEDDSFPAEDDDSYKYIDDEDDSNLASFFSGKIESENEEPQEMAKKSKEDLFHEIESDTSFDEDISEILLLHNNWDKRRILYEFSDKLLENAGIDRYSQEIIDQRIIVLRNNSFTVAPSSFPAVKADIAENLSLTMSNEIFLCAICLVQKPFLFAFALGCDHWFCRDCYASYLKHKVDEGSECTRTKCPAYLCSQMVTRIVFKTLLPPQDYDKYDNFVMRDYISTLPRLAFCISSNCGALLKGTGTAIFNCHVCDKSFCKICSKDECDSGCHSSKVKSNYPDPEIQELIDKDVIKLCPNCKEGCQKGESCNKLECKCGHRFCWVCFTAAPDHDVECLRRKFFLSKA